MTYRQIIERTIALNKACLSKGDQEKAKHREAFSLRNEFGTCSNSEVDLQVIDKSSFFIRHLSC